MRVAPAPVVQEVIEVNGERASPMALRARRCELDRVEAGAVAVESLGEMGSGGPWTVPLCAGGFVPGLRGFRLHRSFAWRGTRPALGLI